MAKRGFKLQEFVAHAADVNCLNIGKKSCRVFVTGGSDGIVNLWAIDTPNSLLSLSGHTTSVQSVAFDSAEVLVLAGASNGSIKLWDLEEGKIVRTLSGHRSSCTFVEFHPFGDFFASGSMDTDLKIWDIRKKGSIHTYKGHTRGIKTIKFTPDGRWVVTGAEDNIVKLWDLTAGKLLHDFKFHKGMIRCIDFHPHEFLLATGSADRTVKFWDLETFELIGSAGPEATGIRSMIFHPDGKTLFCALDEVLKVFSWEPIRCHDAVEMGWSSLADLSIYEEKLLGCSYHQNRVGVWVADISLVQPYATGFVLKKNSLMEPISSNVENSSVGLIGSGTKSNSPLVTGATDYVAKTKDGLGSLSFSSNECSRSPSQESGSIYSTSISSTSDGPKARGSTSNQIVTKKIDSGFSSRVSTLNSTFRVAKAAETSARILRKTTSNCSSRDISPNVDIVGANTLLSSNGHIMESSKPVIVPRNLQEVSVPVIVPRNLPNRGCSRAAETNAEALACDMIFGNSDHVSRTSSLESGNQSQILWTAFGSSRGMTSNLDPRNCNLKSGEVDNAETPAAVNSNQTSIKNVAEKFERIMLEQPAALQNDKSDDVSAGSSNGNCSVKYVRGVAVQLGKTRSLVERFERRENFSSQSPDKRPVMSSGKDLILVDDNSVCDVLLQNHDVFFNALKSRLTKLQVVRHFWKSNGIKEAIDAVAKLPDHSVQIDLVSVLREKIDEFTLELFSCLLPLLVGLVNSKTERHVVMTLEMLLELVKIFGPAVRSTISAPSFGGVDLHAEERFQQCKQCQNHLERIKQNFPSLIRRGGLSAKHVEELNLVFQAL